MSYSLEYSLSCYKVYVFLEIIGNWPYVRMFQNNADEIACEMVGKSQKKPSYSPCVHSPLQCDFVASCVIEWSLFPHLVESGVT